MLYVIRYGDTRFDRETDDGALAALHLASSMETSNQFPWDRKSYKRTKLYINGIEFGPPEQVSVYTRTLPNMSSYYGAVKICMEHVSACTDLYLAFYHNIS